MLILSPLLKAYSSLSALEIVDNFSCPSRVVFLFFLPSHAVTFLSSVQVGDIKSLMFNVSQVFSQKAMEQEYLTFMEVRVTTWVANSCCQVAEDGMQSDCAAGVYLSTQYHRANVTQMNVRQGYCAANYTESLVLDSSVFDFSNCSLAWQIWVRDELFVECTVEDMLLEHLRTENNVQII